MVSGGARFYFNRNFYFIYQIYKQVFKGNDHSKSTSKQVLPVPVEAKYVRIYPMQYEGWPCMRAELYGKGTHSVTISLIFLGVCRQKFCTVRGTIITRLSVINAPLSLEAVFLSRTIL